MSVYMHTGSSGSVGLSKRKRATGSGNKTQHDSRWELPVFTALPTFLPLSPWLFGGCPALPGRALSEPRSSSRELSPRSLAGRSLPSSWRLRGGNLAGAPSQQSPICSKRTLGGSLSRREGCATFAVKLHGWPQRHWLRISKVILIFEKPSQEENTRKASDAGDLGDSKHAIAGSGVSGGMRNVLLVAQSSTGSLPADARSPAPKRAGMCAVEATRHETKHSSFSKTSVVRGFFRHPSPGVTFSTRMIHVQSTRGKFSLHRVCASFGFLRSLHRVGCFHPPTAFTPGLVLN
eukprot:XP_015144403.1 uncharacterized protein LOC101747620 isoform X1 [Gallus gallus]